MSSSEIYDWIFYIFTIICEINRGMNIEIETILQKQW